MAQQAQGCARRLQGPESARHKVSPDRHLQDKTGGGKGDTSSSTPDESKGESQPAAGCHPGVPRETVTTVPFCKGMAR